MGPCVSMLRDWDGAWFHQSLASSYDSSYWHTSLSRSNASANRKSVPSLGVLVTHVRTEEFP